MSKGTQAGANTTLLFCVCCWNRITSASLVTLESLSFLLFGEIHSSIMFVIPSHCLLTCWSYPWGEFLQLLTQTLTSCLSLFSLPATVARKVQSSMFPPSEHATVRWTRIDRNPWADSKHSRLMSIEHEVTDEYPLAKERGSPAPTQQHQGSNLDLLAARGH